MILHMIQKLSDIIFDDKSWQILLRLNLEKAYQTNLNKLLLFKNGIT